jgi:hypothetical protein
VLNVVPTIASVLVSVVLLYRWAPHLIQLSELRFVYNAQSLDFLESTANVGADSDVNNIFRAFESFLAFLLQWETWIKFTVHNIISISYGFRSTAIK